MYGNRHMQSYDSRVPLPPGRVANTAEDNQKTSRCYKFEPDKREYIVETVFKPEGENTLFSLLLNLMRLEVLS